MADMEDLPDEVKTFVVTQLACWDTPTAVALAVKAGYGLELTRQRIEAYDPTKVAGRALSEHYRSVFEEARKRYLADVAEIGIAQQTFRLRALERMYFRAEHVSNWGMAKDLLEQAAKEVGGVYTNKREVSGPDGKPIQHQSVPPEDPEKVKDDVAGLLVDAAAGRDVAGDPPGSNSVLPSSSTGGSTQEPRAPSAGEEVAGEE